MRRFIVPCFLTILTLLYLSSSTLHAQISPIKFEHIGIEQGLSQSTVYRILQDRQGFMWFGTQEGLNKFDGYNFTIYKHDVFDSTSLSANEILSIYEDRKGTLWVGVSGGGLNRFDREKEQFKRFVHNPQNPFSLSDNNVPGIHEDHTGKFWVGTNDGLNLFDRAKEQFTHFVHNSNVPHSLGHNVVLSIFEDRAQTLWIGTEAGLDRFDRETEQFTHFVHDSKKHHSISIGAVTTIYEDHLNVLWIGTAGGGLNRFDRRTERFTHFVHDPQDSHSINHDLISAIHEDRAGTLWIGTRDVMTQAVAKQGVGLNLLDRKIEQFTRLVHDEKNPHSLSDNQVCSIYEDRSGIIWVGTFFGGLNKFDRGKEPFTQFRHDPNDPHSLNQNIINSMYKDQTGTLWVGTHKGLNQYDQIKKQFKHFVHDPNNSHSLSHNSVVAIIENAVSRNTYWIGTMGGGLNRFDLATEHFTAFVHDPNNPSSLSHNIILKMCRAHDGGLWIGTDGGGLNHFDPKTERFTRFVHDPKNPNSLSNNVVWAITQDHSGAVWIGTSDGLNRLDPATGKFTRFLHDPKNPHGLSQRAVYALCVDHTDALWIGTNGGGLNKFNGEAEQFTHYTERDGLCNNEICGILEDDHGRLWLSTNNGISCFDPQTEIFRNYYVADGLPGNEYLVGVYYKSADGEMFFGSFNSGLVAFYPDSIRDNPYIPPVVITACRRYNTDEAEGEPIIVKGISARQDLTLSYKDDVLAFEFAALSYRNTFENQYAYKLEGLSNNWLQLGTKREVTFTNLDPGEYTLRVKGSNNDGVWNEDGASLKITITPPWWRTWWAYTLYFFLFMSLLYGWRRYELNRVHLKNQLKLEQVEAEKMKALNHLKSHFFANISHEFRTPLTLILGPVEQMRGDEFKGNVQEAYDMILRNGRRLLRLINQLLDLARLEAGRLSLQTRPENIVSFLKGLVLSFASAAERKRVNLTISVPEENLIVYFDRDKLEKIVSNLLSNALKFTPEGGSVTVEVGSGTQVLLTSIAAANFIKISVTDTGPGIPTDQLNKIFDRFYQVDASHTREHEGTGLGLALTKELVELHHGEIVVESEVGRGTTFIVRLPLGKEHLKPEEVTDSEQLSVASDQFLVSRDASIEVQASDHLESTNGDRQQAISNEQQGDETIILVVEDNRDVCTYIRQYLEPAFKMIEAHDGVEGVTKALEIIPDLIITDVMMPKRDGNELCRILKADEKTSHVPIIMLTAKADSESKVQGLEIGADDYLIKPFDSRELLARVNNLIKQRQQLRERFSREIVLKPQDIAITPMDEIFLNKVKTVVEKHLGDEDFDVEILGREVGMSRMTVHRKLKALTDQSASRFIRSMRLQRAVELLKQNAGTVAEIAYQVGFGSQAYFTKCFHEQFGCAPKEYVRRSS